MILYSGQPVNCDGPYYPATWFLLSSLHVVYLNYFPHSQSLCKSTQVVPCVLREMQLWNGTINIAQSNVCPLTTSTLSNGGLQITHFADNDAIC